MKRELIFILWKGLVMERIVCETHADREFVRELSERLAGNSFITIVRETVSDELENSCNEEEGVDTCSGIQ
jgi:hypothetical protein